MKRDAVILIFMVFILGITNICSPKIESQTSTVKKSNNDDKILEESIVERKVSGGPLVVDDFYFKGLIPHQKFSQLKNVIKTLFGEPEKIDKNNDNIETNPLHVTYYYSSFQICTVVYKGQEDLTDIILTKNDVKTSRRVAVGDPKEKVISSYGSTNLIYGKYYNYQLPSAELTEGGITADYRIRFYIKNDLVEKIEISLDVHF
jgi:hypothetical protein